ncbi:hypothetical protein HA402_002794 [Bradysia odoriphaga]|nr:hypothetical protein HA402_002794 [Bradysia odoriphaga]
MAENVNHKRSHKEWRKIAKKMRRKKCREKSAKERDRLLEMDKTTPSYRTWLAEQEALELAKEESAEHLRQETHRKWLEYDNLVQEQWKIKQEKLAKIQEAQEQEKLRIRAEFEANRERLRKLKEEKIRLAEEKIEEEKRLAAAIDIYINGSGNLPVELNVNAESNPGKPMCPFFEKTSTCRYGFKCSRNHCRPGISRLLLIPNFFTHIRLDQSKNTEYGSDFSLEIDDTELYRDFNEFFNDVEPELSTFGKIINFCVCSNQEPHLRGHTYVEFDDQRNALKAYRHLQGRYYAGRMLNVEFSQMITWRSAVCGLSFANKCPKGRNCNFLHLFKNPRNKYPLFDKHRCNNGLSTTRRKSLERKRDGAFDTNWDDDDGTSASKKRNWRWSESPEVELATRQSSSRSVSLKRETHSRRSPSRRTREIRKEKGHGSSSRSERRSEARRRRTSEDSRSSERRSRSRRKECRSVRSTGSSQRKSKEYESKKRTK